MPIFLICEIRAELVEVGFSRVVVLERNIYKYRTKKVSWLGFNMLLIHPHTKDAKYMGPNHKGYINEHNLEQKPSWGNIVGQENILIFYRKQRTTAKKL
jgi:hypothetical protein